MRARCPIELVLKNVVVNMFTYQVEIPLDEDI